MVAVARELRHVIQVVVIAWVCHACSPAPSPIAPASTASPPSAPTSEAESPDPEPETQPSEPEPEAITGIEICDRYLAAYQRCEPKLKPEIMAGDRRAYEAEKNWLVFMKDQPERNDLPAACATMQAELDKSCP